MLDPQDTKETTSDEGTGIRLAIVRKAVERMGGSVGVLSEPGQGSRFWIELASAEPKGPHSPPPPEKGMGSVPQNVIAGCWLIYHIQVLVGM